MSIFTCADLLIPEEPLLPDWAVIACDQFTSQPEYWDAVRRQTAGKPSAYHITFPEAELESDRVSRIASIHDNMRRCLAAGFLRSFPRALVYVERQLMDGSVRRGLVGVIDLEAYEYAADAGSAIRATEQTVVERIPPRVQIRSGAALELSHVMLLADDREDHILSACEGRRDALPLLYDFTLMQGGGRITGRLLSGADAEDVLAAVGAYEREAVERYASQGLAPLLYAVGDGNHSLATAKTCWETLKRQNPALAGSDHPARWAMVELQNIHDASQQFEPIHRILTGISPAALLEGLSTRCAPAGHEVRWAAGERSGTVTLSRALGELPVAILQPFLDRWLEKRGGKIDYIHGDEVALELARQDDALAFLLPNISKADFFPGIVKGGVLPRKTFSMGHAQEKRYYLECRKIVE